MFEVNGRLHRKGPKEEIIKARVSVSLKRNIRALALARSETSESIVVREALSWYVEQPAIQEMLRRGLERLEEVEKQEAQRQAQSAEKEELSISPMLPPEVGQPLGQGTEQGEKTPPPGESPELKPPPQTDA